MIDELFFGQAHHDLFILGFVIIIFSRQDGFGVEVVTIAGHLKTLQEPVSVLLNDVSVELMGCEAGDFPPGVGCEAEVGACSCYSDPPEVLIELCFVDFFDSEPADGDESAGDALCGEEEH